MWYRQHVGKAAGMRDLIETLKDETTRTSVAPDKVEALATTWLRSTGMPTLPELPE